MHHKLLHIVAFVMLLFLALESAAQCPGWVYAGKDSTVCYSNNVVYLDGKIRRTNGQTGYGYWSGGNGQYSPAYYYMNATYIPSMDEVNAGYVDLVLIPYQNCYPSKADTVRITIRKVGEESISGPLAACEYSGGNSYSVANKAGLNYSWHVVGGTISSGSGTNSITVNWGAEGPGYIYLVQTDNLGCYGVGSLNPISRFNLNTSDIGKADIGSDATSYDSDAIPNGSGFVITSNCGGSKGLDLVLPGSNFDRGKMCMTFSWQRDESQANFFRRGGTEFYISGGTLYVKLTQYNSSGASQVVGPVSTGYTVPNDDVMRHFTFCYDSSSGVARVLVNDNLVWNYSTGSTSSLYWVGAGSAYVGEMMDGSCSGNTLLDWINVSVPVSIIPKPSTAISGNNPACQYGEYLYSCDTPSRVTYNWSSNGGTIQGSNTGPAAWVNWNTVGSNSMNLLLTDTVTGCDSSFVFGVSSHSAPDAGFSGEDSLCVGEQETYEANTTGLLYSWSGTLNGAVSDSATYFQEMTAAGTYSIYLEVIDTLTTCSNADTLTIWSHALPDSVMTGPASACPGETETYQVNSASDLNYSWNVSGGTIVSGQGSSEVAVKFPASGTVSLAAEITVQGFGCSVTGTISPQVFDKPVTGTIRH